MRFRLLTYNIHRAIGLDRRFRPERIAAILEHYDADIVALQEVDSGAPRSRMLDLAAHLAEILRYDHRALGLNVFLRIGQYGNATLSRFPIKCSRNIDLKVERGIRRGALHTQIALPNHALDVFNIHLSLTERTRHRQIPHVLSSEELTCRAGSGRCLVAGDTNDWRGTLRQTFFTPAGFHCATNHATASHRALKTYPSFAPTMGLDKVFYRGSLKLLQAYRGRIAATLVASDHLPVIVDFEVVD